VEATETAWTDGEAVRGGELGYVSTFLVLTCSIDNELFCEFKLVELAYVHEAFDVSRLLDG